MNHLTPSSPSARPWVSPPELSDDAIRNGTGKGWDEWCALLDAFPGRNEGHKAIAAFVRSDFGFGDWWAQAVTVGYERIVGLRVPHQMADGTFTANKSRIVSINTDLLRTLLLDDEHRQHLFPGLASELRSKPEAKALRVSIGPGTATIRLDDRGANRTKIAIQHASLPTIGDVEEWKFYWSDWLDAIDGADQ